MLSVDVSHRLHILGLTLLQLLLQCRELCVEQSDIAVDVLYVLLYAVDVLLVLVYLAVDDEQIVETLLHIRLIGTQRCLLLLYLLLHGCALALQSAYLGCRVSGACRLLGCFLSGSGLLGGSLSFCAGRSSCVSLCRLLLLGLRRGVLALLHERQSRGIHRSGKHCCGKKCHYKLLHWLLLY